MAPFKSKRQIAKFAELVSQGKMQKATFDKWMRETRVPPAVLPERIHPPKPAPNTQPTRPRRVRSVLKGTKV